jgi:hypothetical protein
VKDDSGTNELRAELQRLTTSLQRETLEGNASDDSRYTLERAEYLAKLLDLAERTRTRRSTRWQIPATLFGVGVVVLALVTIPVWRTNAVINVRSSALAVRLDRDRAQELTDRIEVAFLDLANIGGSVRLPMAKDASSHPVPERDLPLDAQLELTAQGPPRPGVITLKPMVGASDSLFEMRSVGQGQIWMRWQPGASLDAALVSLKGWVRVPREAIRDAAAQSTPLQHEPAKAMRIDLGDSGFAEWTLQPINPVAFRLPILVRAVNFNSEPSGRAGTPPASAIRTGTLRVAGIDGVESLREGEELTIAVADKPLTITSLAVDGHDIVLRIEGDVTRLETALAGERRNRMPTVLGWIRANPTLSLLWSAILFLFGVMTGVSRWWKGE